MPLKKDIKILDFSHEMSAHCENGVTRNLLRFHNINLSEAMIFGLGSGLFFSFLPFLKMNGVPITSFRPVPGLIFKRVNSSLGIQSEIKKYPKKEQLSMDKLDQQLEKGIPTAMVVGVYHLTYFPAPYRFHFNAHNIIAFGKKDNKYIISDPIMESEEWISYDDLKRVRYAKGAYKPKGKMYWIKSVPNTIDLKTAIVKSIKRTAQQMVVWPGPIIGTSGIRLLAKHIVKWEKKYNSRKASKYLGSIVRMQEEIGTGGAGFRFLYGAFLEEASQILDSPELEKASKEITRIGDMWRDFATKAARICKFRASEEETYSSVSELLIKISYEEEKLFKSLIQITKKL